MARVVLLIACVFLIPAWVIPFWLLKDIVAPGELLPLHYNVYLGVDFVSVWYTSLYFPGFATGVVLTNGVLAMRWRAQSPLLANILLFSALIISALVVLALFFVLVLNA